jgi:hypothetical protein
MNKREAKSRYENPLHHREDRAAKLCWIGNLLWNVEGANIVTSRRNTYYTRVVTLGSSGVVVVISNAQHTRTHKTSK